MILDLNQYTLSYIINGEDYDIAFKDIESTKYSTCITGYCHTKIFELQTFVATIQWLLIQIIVIFHIN